MVDWEAEWNKIRAEYLAQNTELVNRGRQLAAAQARIEQYEHLLAYVQRIEAPYAQE